MTVVLNERVIVLLNLFFRLNIFLPMANIDAIKTSDTQKAPTYDSSNK